MALVFRDTFTVGANTLLSARTPDTGTSYTLMHGENADLHAVATTDFMGDDGSGGLSDGAWYAANATYPSADYEVSAKIAAIDSGDDAFFLAARVADNANFYGVFFSSGFYRIIKVVAGVVTTLNASAGETAFNTTPINDAPATGDIVSFIVNGTTLEFRVNGVLVESVTDSAISAAGKAGIGIGNCIANNSGGEGGDYGYDCDAQFFDDFRVHTLATAGATTETLRPNGAGTTTQLTPNAGSNYDQVDEASSDGDTTYNKTPSGGFADRFDTYAIPAPAAGASDIIDYFEIHALSRRSVAAAGEDAAPAFRIGATNFMGLGKDPGTSYVEQIAKFYHNPVDGTALTQTLIDGLEPGAVHHSSNLGLDDLRTTQVWAVYAYKSNVAAAVTGTITAAATEADIRAGGKTIIITLTGDTWVASGATFDAQRQAIIDGLDAAASPGGGWNNEVRDNADVTDVVRTSDTVVTITLEAFGSYDISATETITVTVPASALTGGVAITATPTFTVIAVTAGGAYLPTMGIGN